MRCGRPFPPAGAAAMQRILPRSKRKWCLRSVPATSSWSRARTVRAWHPSSRRCNGCIHPLPTLPRLRGRVGRGLKRPHKVEGMLYWLVDLSDKLSVLNVFRYITFRTGGAVITALLFVFLFGQIMIDRLRLFQGKGQPIRADGPQSHIIAKAGTPTMGGLMILSGMLVSTLLWANPTNPYVWVVLWVTLGFGFVGFYDDYLKVKKQTHNGFAGRTRLGIETLIAAVACIVFVQLGHTPFSTSLVFPFFKDLVINLSWAFVLFAAFIIVGAGNAVNLTDGLDGLAIVPVMIASASFGMISYLSGNAVFSDYLQIHYVAGTGELAVLCGAVVG